MEKSETSAFRFLNYVMFVMTCHVHIDIHIEITILNGCINTTLENVC